MLHQIILLNAYEVSLSISTVVLSFDGWCESRNACRMTSLHLAAFFNSVQLIIEILETFCTPDITETDNKILAEELGNYMEYG